MQFLTGSVHSGRLKPERGSARDPKQLISRLQSHVPGTVVGLLIQKKKKKNLKKKCKINREALVSASILPRHPSRLQLDLNLGYHGTHREHSPCNSVWFQWKPRPTHPAQAMASHPPFQPTQQHPGTELPKRVTRGRGRFIYF